MHANSRLNSGSFHKITAGLLGTLLALLVSVSAEAGTLYWGGGSSDIGNGTALPAALTSLTGGWDTTTKNWATDASGTTYTNWSNTGTNNHAYLGMNMTSWAQSDIGTLTLSESMALNRLSGNFRGASHYDATFSLTAASPVTLTLNGQNPVIYVDDYSGYENITLQPNVRLAGTSGFTLVNDGELRIGSDCSGLTGNVTVCDPEIPLYLTQINTADLYIKSTGNLRGITRFNVTGIGGGLQVVAPSGAANQLGDTAEINLMGGCLTYYGYRGASSSQETIDHIRLDSSGKIDLNYGSGGSGTPLGQLILANATSGIDRGTDGKGCLLVSDALPLTTDVIVQNGITTNVVLPWMATDQGRPVQLNAAKAITPVATTAAPLDLSTWSTGSHKYRIEGGTSSTIGDVAIDTLGILSGQTVTIGDGKTLTLSQGLLGIADYATSVITGGKLTSGTSELYAIHSAANLTINSEITGNMSLIMRGNNTVNTYLGGTTANTYNGTTYVMGGNLYLTKSSGVAIPGNLVIGRAKVRFQNANQHTPGADLTIRDGGRLEVVENYHQLSGLVTVEGGGLLSVTYSCGATFNKAGMGLAMNGGTLLHDHAAAATIKLLTDVSYATDSAAQAFFRCNYSGATNIQNITLCDAAGTYTRTFNIGSSTNVTGGKPEMEIAIPLMETGGGTVGITKTGAGTLSLRRTRYYFYNGSSSVVAMSGPVTVNGGRLVSAGTWQAVTRQGTMYTGAGVDNHPFYTITDLSRTDDLAVGQPVSGTGIPDGTVIARIDSPTQIRVSLPWINIQTNITTVLTFGGGGNMAKGQTLTGTRTAGSPIITGLSSTTGLVVGQRLTSTSTGVGDFNIVSIDSATQITLNNNAGSSGTGSITFLGASAVGTGPVTVNSTGILMGDGVAGVVTNNSGGTIDAGVTPNQAYTMQFGTNLVFMAGSTQQVDIASDSVSDQLQVMGNITLAGTVNPNLLGSYSPSEGSWIIATYTGTATGSMDAPGRYLVTIDSGNKQIVLTKRPNNTGFVIGVY